MIEVLHKRAKGNIGEDIACKFLVNKGFSVIERNFQRKWGELDIIAKKDNIIHFFEVKSVVGSYSKDMVDGHKPEDNVDGWKVKHLRRIIETYLAGTEKGMETEFQFHVICVYMDVHKHLAHVNWLNNIIL